MLLLFSIYAKTIIDGNLLSSGPLSGTSEVGKDKKAFGSHDIQSHHVISNLKKVTIALEGGHKGAEDGEGLENGKESSLDFSSLDKPMLRQYRCVGEGVR